MDRTLIVNATVVDGSRAAPLSGDVLVEGEPDLLVGELARLHWRLLRPHRWGGPWDRRLPQNVSPGGLKSGEECRRDCKRRVLTLQCLQPAWRIFMSI